MIGSARIASVLALSIGVIGSSALAATPPVNTVDWTGGATGNWNTANAWKNTTTNVTGTSTDAAIFGQKDGSSGMNTTNPATTRARNIVIGGGAVVTYPHQDPTINSDFRITQGSTLTIKEGAVWQQVTDNTYSENGWTQMDMSKLTLDGGTFRRSGVSPAGDGGGLVLFASYRDDDNIQRLGPPKIAVEMKNGGKIENNGQLWFGADDEHSPDVQVGFTINNGSMDLTGGTIPQTNSTLPVSADLAFFYDYSEALNRPKNEQWSINFTGPGSITVDSAGIWVYDQDSSSIWNDHGGPVTYQYLWDRGILQANGLSGSTADVNKGNGTTVARTPANFNDFFTVTGTPGSNDYTLTSLIMGVATLNGDYNGNGKVDAADYVLWRDNPGAYGGAGGYNTWRSNFGATAGSGAGLGAGASVPEPASVMLVLMGLAAIGFRRRSA